MEAPRLGVKSELQLLAYTTAAAMQVPSHMGDYFHHSSGQCQILNPLSKARDQIHNLMVPGQIPFCCAMTGTSHFQKSCFFLCFVYLFISFLYWKPPFY